MTTKRILELSRHDCIIVKNTGDFRTYFTIEIDKHFTRKEAYELVSRLTKETKVIEQ